MYQRKNPLGPPSGATTPDGSPGDIYVRANAERQDRALRAEVSGVGSVLEMGCGVGSLLERIELLGVEVHGVDESIEMLSYANIPTTCSTIERFNIHEMLRPSFVDGIHR